ncbi:uncharacterized protein BDZ99DRAFT_470947 [Mytilinidion resinicola]|uniref:Uncharacterized protein n=1 Tax=Mytilinidion resinicola TaxID=574789 RepID=A0A6A6ZCJ6_9PEZI|nr:uncharacterized protein BDZ99DRAFT_470947 [Mytilinidion resinicola]KAF2818025.1 hypothetical protein BDZ99DRAFT_470947 [Mytilinidion resinicola]
MATVGGFLLRTASAEDKEDKEEEDKEKDKEQGEEECEAIEETENIAKDKGGKNTVLLPEKWNSNRLKMRGNIQSVNYRVDIQHQGTRAAADRKEAIKEEYRRWKIIRLVDIEQQLKALVEA